MDMYDKIDNILQKRGISRRQLAIDAKIPPATLQSALARKKNMSMEMVLKITSALLIPINEIMDEADLWGTKSEIAKEQEESVSTQLDKLSDDEKIYLLTRFDTALEYIERYENSSEALQRLSDLISAYGQMIITSLEMRLGTKTQQADYLGFLRYYDRCIDMLNTHKRELLDATLNFRKGDPKLRELIYGKDEK